MQATAALASDIRVSLAAHSLPRVGYAEDVERTGRREIAAFFRKNYGPANLTISIVGDVKPEQVRMLPSSRCCFAQSRLWTWSDASGSADPMPQIPDSIAPLTRWLRYLQVRRLAERYFDGWSPEPYTRLPAGTALLASASAEGLPRPSTVAGTGSNGGALYRESSEVRRYCVR